MNNRQKELINQLTDKELLINFYTSQLFLFFIAILLGFFLFDEISDLFLLFNFKDFLSILVIGGGSGLIIVLIDLILMKFLPSTYYDDGGMNKRLFTNRGFLQIILMALIVAFCEELLFRGVLQTNFGLIIASSIFAILHIRYLSNLFLFFSIFILSFFIGFIYYWTENLAVTFFMHFIIDCLLGLFINYNYIQLKSSTSSINGGDKREQR